MRVLFPPPPPSPPFKGGYLGKQACRHRHCLCLPMEVALALTAYLSHGNFPMGAVMDAMSLATCHKAPWRVIFPNEGFFLKGGDLGPWELLGLCCLPIEASLAFVVCLCHGYFPVGLSWLWENAPGHAIALVAYPQGLLA